MCMMQRDTILTRATKAFRVGIIHRWITTKDPICWKIIAAVAGPVESRIERAKTDVVHSTKRRSAEKSIHAEIWHQADECD